MIPSRARRNSLTNDDRRIIVEAYIAGRRSSDIAAVLGRPRSTVDSVLRTCRVEGQATTRPRGGGEEFCLQRT